MDQHDLAAEQFGSAAREYLTSSVHASGADLDRVAELASRSHSSSALDLGCGAGHISYALARGGMPRVVAYDLAPPMLDVVAAEAKARGHGQIETCAGPAERLPFADASFDWVITRYSAHHWLDVGQALSEAARVLKPGGKIGVIDILAPERPLLDTVLQTVEILRDASHVRDYRESEWLSMLATANFRTQEVARWKLSMDFESWVARIGTSAPRIDALKVVFAALPVEARDYFSLTSSSFTIDAGWFEATRQP